MRQELCRSIGVSVVVGMANGLLIFRPVIPAYFLASPCRCGFIVCPGPKQSHPSISCLVASGGPLVHAGSKADEDFGQHTALKTVTTVISLSLLEPEAPSKCAAVVPVPGLRDRRGTEHDRSTILTRTTIAFSRVLSEGPMRKAEKESGG